MTAPPTMKGKLPVIDQAGNVVGNLPNLSEQPGAALVELVSGAAHIAAVATDVQERALVLRKGLSMDEWGAVGRALGRMDQSVMWWLGDWLAYGELDYGEKAAQALDASGYSYQRLKQAAWVARKFQPAQRTHDVDFAHYEAAAGLAGKDPEAAARILTQAQNGGASEKEVRRMVREYQRATAPAAVLPAGTFNVVLADPPWKHDDASPSRDVERFYPTMTTEDIEGMEMPTIDPKGAALFLWATGSMLPDALRVMAAWGFEYKAHYIWRKEGAPGMGYWTRNQHEILLVGASGDFGPPPEDKRFASVVDAARMGHSQKPAVFLEMIEQMYPAAQRIELFSRQRRPGWEGWGKDYPGDTPKSAPAPKGEAKSKAEQAASGKPKRARKAKADAALPEGEIPGEPMPDAEPVVLDPADVIEAVEGEIVGMPGEGIQEGPEGMEPARYADPADAIEAEPVEVAD